MVTQVPPPPSAASGWGLIPPSDSMPEDLSPADGIYSALRQHILSSDIEPGSWLRQVDVAEQFGVSRTPVREAFRSLAQEGLVEIIPNYGVRVAPLLVESFEELYALRIGIEGLAARLAAERISVGQQQQLGQRLQALDAQRSTVPLATYIHEEWRFRLGCYQVTERSRLVAQIIYLREHAERYLRLAYDLDSRRSESFAYHRALMSALEVRDGQLAEATVQAALRWTLQRAVPLVRERVHSSAIPDSPR